MCHQVAGTQAFTSRTRRRAKALIKLARYGGDMLLYAHNKADRLYRNAVIAGIASEFCGPSMCIVARRH